LRVRLKGRSEAFLIDYGELLAHGRRMASRAPFRKVG